MFKTKPAAPPEVWTGQRWEYKSVTKVGGELAELNRLGQLGWELVAIAGAPPHTMRAVLKRPLQQDAREEIRGAVELQQVP